MGDPPQSSAVLPRHYPKPVKSPANKFKSLKDSSFVALPRHDSKPVKSSAGKLKSSKNSLEEILSSKIHRYFNG